jgi:hypothetical protein
MAAEDGGVLLLLAHASRQDLCAPDDVDDEEDEQNEYECANSDVHANPILWGFQPTFLNVTFCNVPCPLNACGKHRRGGRAGPAGGLGRREGWAGGRAGRRRTARLDRPHGRMSGRFERTIRLGRHAGAEPCAWIDRTPRGLVILSARLGGARTVPTDDEGTGVTDADKPRRADSGEP